MNQGINCIIGKNVSFGENVTLKHNIIIEDNVSIGNNCYIDSNTIIRSNTTIGNDAFIEANCIIGEYQMNFINNREKSDDVLKIGEKALIRSGSILYTGSYIGDNFQTGHQVTIREKSNIGNFVSIGTLSDIQGNCEIGNYVRMHSNVHIGQLSKIDDYVWIFPYVVLTNDPNPPSEELEGVHVKSFAIIATGTIVLPGKVIGQDALIGAGSIVTKDVDDYSLVVGSPIRYISDVREIKNKKSREKIYPWREQFTRGMPWNESTFNEWFNELSSEDKDKYNLNNIIF